MFDRSIRSCAAAALVLLGSVGVPRPVAATTGHLCLFGATSGDWDLPAGVGSLGFLDGVLFRSPQQPLYQFAGTLTEISSPCFSCREGFLDAVLDDGVGPGPDYMVQGHWIGSFLGGTGTWTAAVYKPIGPALVQVGSMSGDFADPPSLPDLPGKFDGRWTIGF